MLLDVDPGRPAMHDATPTAIRNSALSRSRVSTLRKSPAAGGLRTGICSRIRPLRPTACSSEVRAASRSLSARASPSRAYLKCAASNRRSEVPTVLDASPRGIHDTQSSIRAASRTPGLSTTSIRSSGTAKCDLPLRCCKP